MSFGRNHKFEFEYAVAETLSPRIRRIVARNPGPFTFHGTSTFIIGHGQVAIIDPGPLIDEHIDAIFDAVKDETISHILVTHTHMDHSPAAQRLQQFSHAPTVGFGQHPTIENNHPAAAGIDHLFVPDLTLADGGYIKGPDWTLRALHTPGHCYNHLCYYLTQESTLLVGDHLMAWASSIIIAPDGRVSDYLTSLDRVLAIGAHQLFPAHGAAITKPSEFIHDIRAHRLQRIRQVEQQIKSGVSTIDAMIPVLYPKLDKRLYFGAALSILANTIYLQEQKRIICDDVPDFGRCLRPFVV